MAHEQEETPAYHEELQAVLKMLTTMALLHEAQLAIHRQDTAFRHLLEDRCPGQSGHDDVCLRSEMARDEVGDARKVGGANAGHPLPAPGEDGDGPLREDGWLPVGEVEGSGAGVAQRGRDSDPGCALGCGEPSTCEGPGGDPPVNRGRQGGATGAGGDEHQAFGGDSIPCYTQAGGAVHVTHPDHVVGGGQPHRGSRCGVEEAPQAGEIGSVGGLGGLPQEGAHAAQPPGSEVGYRDGVLALRLGNRGNACYCNTMLLCLLYASSWKGGPEWMFAGSMLQYVRSILRRADIIHVWTHPLWVMMMRGWRLPNRQHDIVEFFQYFLGCQPHTERRLRLVWQARAQQEDGGIGGDGGTSSPLLLQPPERAAMVDDYATSVQRLIEEWHEQDAMHAALCLPQILTFQVGRFDYSPDSGEARKRRYARCD